MINSINQALSTLVIVDNTGGFVLTDRYLIDKVKPVVVYAKYFLQPSSVLSSGDAKFDVAVLSSSQRM